jgi:hypothetical protein
MEGLGTVLNQLADEGESGFNVSAEAEALMVKSLTWLSDAEWAGSSRCCRAGAAGRDVSMIGG